MDAARVIDRLERSLPAILSLFAGASEDEERWRPAPGKWSMIEVAGHLLDEERDDFRTRVRLTLEDPALDWLPIHPEQWVRERGHDRRRSADLLAELERERAASLAWLRGLAAPDWSRSHLHPTAGPLAAGDLLAAWAAHDLLHLRQLANLRLARLAADAAPFATSYAG